MSSSGRYSRTSESDITIATCCSNLSDIGIINITCTPKRVRFGTISIREYSMTMGVNPATRIGAPVCLDWEYIDHPPFMLDPPLKLDDAQLHPSKKNPDCKNKSPADFYLNYYQRLAIVERAGFSKADFKRAEKAVSWQRFKRKLSEYQSYPILWLRSWRFECGRRHSERFVEKYRREHGLEHSKKRPPKITA